MRLNEILSCRIFSWNQSTQQTFYQKILPTKRCVYMRKNKTLLQLQSWQRNIHNAQSNKTERALPDECTCRVECQPHKDKEHRISHFHRRVSSVNCDHTDNLTHLAHPDKACGTPTLGDFRLKLWCCAFLCTLPQKEKFWYNCWPRHGFLDRVEHDEDISFTGSWFLYHRKLTTGVSHTVELWVLLV